MPQEDRLHTHSFAKPSNQLSGKVYSAILRSIHNTSLYMRLALVAKQHGRCRNRGGKPTHYTSLYAPPLKLAFMNLNLLTVNLTTASSFIVTGTPPLTRTPYARPAILPDSYAHIAREYSHTSVQVINRHNVACLLAHKAIRSSRKKRINLHAPKCFKILIAYVGSHPLAAHSTQHVYPSPAHSSIDD